MNHERTCHTCKNESQLGSDFCSSCQNSAFRPFWEEDKQPNCESCKYCNVDTPRCLHCLDARPLWEGKAPQDIEDRPETKFWRRSEAIHETKLKNLASDLLMEASRTLTERGKTYDTANKQERSMAQTVDVFNLLTGNQLTEVEGWQFMQVLKDVRFWTNPDNPHRDSLLDGIAYAALKAEAACKPL